MIYQTEYGMVDVHTKVIDYVDEDGDVFVDMPVKEILITSVDDLENLTEYPIGSIAYTPALTSIYILDSTKTWVELGTEIEVVDDNEVAEEVG